MQDTVMIPLFGAILTLAMGAAFFLFYQAWQRTWSKKADDFRLERVPAIALMKQMAREHAQAAHLIEDLEEDKDRLQYRLQILGDLTEVAASFAEDGPLSDDDFRAFLTNVVLAGTQALLPTQTNTRARLLIYDGERLRPYASYVRDGAQPFKGRTFLPGEGAVGLAFEKAEAVIVSDAKTDILFVGEPTPSYSSVLCVPVQGNGARPIGVLNVDSPQVNYFTEDDARTLAHVANLIRVLWVLQFPLVRQYA